MKSMSKIKSIKVSAVRGLRDFQLDLDRKSLLLFGENGSGKSSLVDALEFFFRGAIAHLEGTQGLSLNRHAPHVELGADKLEVELVFASNSTTPITRSLDGQSEVPANLGPFFTETRRTNFLRRAQLLDFIYADPANRFRVLSGLIGLEELDGIELAFMRTRDRLEAEQNAAVDELNRVRRRLGALVGEPEADPSLALERLNGVAEDLSLTPVESTEGIADAITLFRQATKQADQEVLARLSALKTAAEAVDVSGLADRLVAYSTSADGWRDRQADVGRLAEASFLEQGERLLSGNEWVACPLCEQPFDQQAVSVRTSQRRAELQQLSIEFSEFRTSAQTLAAALRSLGQRASAVEVRLWDDVDPDAELRKELASHSEALTSAATQIDASTRFEDECDAGAVLEITKNLNSLASRAAERVQEKFNELNQTERDREVWDLTVKLEQLRAGSRDFTNQNRAVETTSVQHQRAAGLFEAFSTSKKAAVQTVYETIEADVNSFYEQLHPGEPHHDFKLGLVEGRRASTTLSTRTFGGEAADPRAYASEGHLDSLGLCIFLAFVKHFGDSSRFMVLDDVIMSIDSGHRSRVAELLLNEFHQWQLILTTHDDIWFNEFVDHERAHGKLAAFINLRIQRWTLEDGPLMQAFVPRWERIGERLDAGDKTAAANDGRSYLEWVLKELCGCTEALVAFNATGRYAAGDLFQPARSRLVDLLPEKAEEIKDLFQEVEASAGPGNLLSHDNANSLAMSIAEVRRFCEAVHELQQWFSCDGCGRSPVYVQGARVLMCQNARCADQMRWDTAK